MLAGALGIGGAGAAAATAPATASAFVYSCHFSQIGNYYSPLYTTNGYGTQYLQPCDGVYVVCWGYSHSALAEKVNWTYPYGWRFQGWIRDSDLQTYGNPPWDYWKYC